MDPIGTDKNPTALEENILAPKDGTGIGTKKSETAKLLPEAGITSNHE